MLRVELHKLFHKKKIYLILFVGIVLEIMLSTQMKTIMFQGFNKGIYQYYIRQLEGNYTPEKQEEVEKEYARLQTLLDNEEIYEEQYRNNEIDAEEYRKLSTGVKSAQSRIATVKYILEKSNYFSTINGNPEYFYDIEIADYIENMSMDFVLLAVLTLLIACIYTEDFYAGTTGMVRSSGNGKNKLFFCRLKITLLISASLGFLFPAIEFSTKDIKFDLGNLNADVSSLQAMQNSQLHISICQYILLTVLVRAIYTMAAGIVIMWISIQIHNNVAVFAVTAGIIALPYFVSTYVPAAIQSMLLCKGLGGYDMFSTYHTICGVPYTCLAILFHCILSFALIMAAKHIDRKSAV